MQSNKHKIAKFCHSKLFDDIEKQPTGQEILKSDPPPPPPLPNEGPTTRLN